jgi:nucleotidyltransferase substrate binding protein (TIGR01987 family)
MMPSLDLTSLSNAVTRLEEGLARCHREPDDTQLRDGLVQRFEFSYELSHKILKRHLEQTAASPEEIDRMAFADLIRTGNEQGLLRGDWNAWREYREMRSRTSHTYDENSSKLVVAGIPAFLAEVHHLLGQLEKRATSPS